MSSGLNVRILMKTSFEYIVLYALFKLIMNGKVKIANLNKFR